MTDELPLNTSATPRKRGPNKVTRARSGADMPEHMAAVDVGLGGRTRESAAHSTKRPARVAMGQADLILTVPSRYLDPNKYHRFIADRDGRVDKAKEAWYEFVTDENGVNIVRSSKGTKMYLMALDKQYRDDDVKLKQKQYRASINQEADKDLGIAGLETDTDKGRKSALESRESSDRDGY